MTAEEIRTSAFEVLAELKSDKYNMDQTRLGIEAARLSMLAEIAAQLAELNAKK